MLTTNFQKYAGILIVFGHGEGDPGCVHRQWNEAEMVRKLAPYLKQWAKQAQIPVTFYYKNLYWHTQDLLQYKNHVVVELHLDAAQHPGVGGHVIIYAPFQPDNMDRNLIQFVAKHFGIVTRTGHGLDKRQDLKNMNVAAQAGINYRLVELFFLANQTDRDYYLAHLDQLAKEMLEAIIGRLIPSCTCKA